MNANFWTFELRIYNPEPNFLSYYFFPHPEEVSQGNIATTDKQSLQLNQNVVMYLSLPPKFQESCSHFLCHLYWLNSELLLFRGAPPNLTTLHYLTKVPESSRIYVAISKPLNRNLS